MTKITRYQLGPENHIEIQMPLGGKVLGVDSSDCECWLWVEEDTSIDIQERRAFRTVVDGVAFESKVPLVYIGYVKFDGHNETFFIYEELGV